MARTVIHCINSASSLSGGVGFALQAMCANVQDVHPVVFACRDKEASLISPSTPQFFFERTGPYSLSYSRPLEKALDAFVSDHPDAVLHVHGLWSGLSHTINVIRRSHPSLRYVVSPHGMLEPSRVKRRRVIKRLMRLLWEESLLRNATRIHALTSAEEMEIRSFAPEASVFLQPNMVSFPFSSDELRDQWRIRSTKTKTLVFLGRIHEIKGVAALVDHIALRAREDRPINFRLLIAGFGASEAVEELTRKVDALDDNVLFLGSVFDDRKDELLRNAHGFILPSMSEGLPMALVEAAAYGLPLFITKECNFNWVEGKEAGRVASYSPDGIAELVRVFDEASLAELTEKGTRAFEYGYANFSGPRVSHAWTTLYNQL